MWLFNWIYILAEKYEPSWRLFSEITAYSDGSESLEDILEDDSPEIKAKKQIRSQVWSTKS